jgi:hypothetical protein
VTVDTPNAPPPNGDEWYLPSAKEAFHPPPQPPPPAPRGQVILGAQMQNHIFVSGPVSGTATELDAHVDLASVGFNLGVLGVSGGLLVGSVDFLRREAIHLTTGPANVEVQLLLPVPEVKFVLGASNDFFVGQVALTGIRVVRCPFVAELRLPSLEAWTALQAGGSTNNFGSTTIATGGGLTLGLIL